MDQFTMQIWLVAFKTYLDKQFAEADSPHNQGAEAFKFADAVVAGARAEAESRRVEVES